MASLAISVAGAGVGHALGWGIPALGLSGAGVGWTAFSIIGAHYLGPDQPDTHGPRLDDLSVTASTYGNMIPIVCGTIPLPGNIIDASDRRETAHKQTSGGGKGSGSGPSHTTYTASIDLDISLCEGPITGVVQMFCNEKLYYDATPGATVRQPTWLKMTVYTGSETQEPDPVFEALRGVGEVPAYRGEARVVLEDFQLSDFNNALPTFRFVVTTAGSIANTSTNIDVGVPVQVRDALWHPETDLCWVFYRHTSESTVDRLFGIDFYTSSVIHSIPLEWEGRGSRYHEGIEPVGFDALEPDRYIMAFANRLGSPDDASDIRAWLIDSWSGALVTVSDAMPANEGLTHRFGYGSMSRNRCRIWMTQGYISGGTDENRIYDVSFNGTTLSFSYLKVNSPTNWSTYDQFALAVKRGDNDGAVLAVGLGDTGFPQTSWALWVFRDPGLWPRILLQLRPHPP